MNFLPAILSFDPHGNLATMNDIASELYPSLCGSNTSPDFLVNSFGLNWEQLILLTGQAPRGSVSGNGQSTGEDPVAVNWTFSRISHPGSAPAGAFATILPQKTAVWPYAAHHYFRSFAHDVRTPVSSVKESVSLVADKLVGEINETQSKCMEVARGEIVRINQLVNESLCISRSLIASPPGSNACHFAQAQERLQPWLAPLIEKKRLKLDIQCDWPVMNREPLFECCLNCACWLTLAGAHHADPESRINITGSSSSGRINFSLKLQSRSLASMKWSNLQPAPGDPVRQNYEAARGLDPLLTAALRYLPPNASRISIQADSPVSFQLEWEVELPPLQTRLVSFIHTLLSNLQGPASKQVLHLRETAPEQKMGPLLTELHHVHPSIYWTASYSNPGILVTTGDASTDALNALQQWSQESSVLRDSKNSVSVESIQFPENITNLLSRLKEFCESEQFNA